MKIILTSLLMAASISLFAAPKKKTNSDTGVSPSVSSTQIEEVEPIITEECQRNISIMHEYVKNKQFASAYEPWKAVYNSCPNANKVIYTDGSKIIEWLFDNAKTEKEKNDLAQLAIDACDKRIKYFGNDTKYPRVYILGEKGLEYCKYFSADTIKEKAYPWLKESIEGMKEKSKLSVLNKFMEISYDMYKSDPGKYGEQYLADYTKISDIFAIMIANSKDPSTITAYKDYIDNFFAQSGAASCSKLDELYQTLVENSKDDVDVLVKIMRLYKKVKCTESDVYFSASQYVHMKNPSVESAVGCAKMCMKKEDWENALNYYLQALELLGDNEDEDKADYHYTVAFIYCDKMHRYETAKSHLLKAINLDSNTGKYYILLGICYANAKPYTEKDTSPAKCAILNKTVFWAAVDKFIKARNVDPTCADDANKLIKTYSKFFPTREEIFDLPNDLGKEGSSFKVPGWVNEITTCRSVQ